MGTEFEKRAYISGYFDMADSSVNSNGNVSPYYEKKPTLHHSNKFTISSANGSVQYDKEMLKRTMLVHEATFRKQVYELHRLYKIQKDLMSQFQGGEVHDYPRYADTLKSRTYASQAPPGDANAVWQNGTPISGLDLKQSSIDFINETSSQYSVNGASLGCGNIRSRKKMFDLQLPADVYADDDDVEILDKDPLKCLPGADDSVHDGNDRINLYKLQKRTDQNTSIARLQHEHKSTKSSFGQYLSGNSSFNHSIPALPLFNNVLNFPWQSNNTSHYGISMGSSSTYTPCYHLLKPPPQQNTMKDLDLNYVPADATFSWQIGSESSLVDTSAFSKKPSNLINSEVPPSCANGQSQTCVSSTLYSDDGTLTRIPSFPITAAAEKDSQSSPSLECGINIATSLKCDADKDMQPQSKNADSSFRNLFDLNEALPIMDDLEADACEPEVPPHEPNDPSRDSLAITAADNLVAMCNDAIQLGSPQADTLHWFADLATSKENNDSDDDFEALTLKLEETKSYEFSLPPPEAGRTQDGDNNDGHCSAASLLVTRPRRVKARGRPPKKKDFQKHILPSLASLPEEEVSEDLHLLGRSKPVTPARQRGRNGQKTRGRRRLRSAAAVVVVEEVEVHHPLAPPPPPHVPADLDADALRITRWGRTTRRCRRPRCPPVNNASLHVA